MSKLYPFPVLSHSTYDYTEENKLGYKVSVHFLKDRVAVRHTILGKNLVSAMLRESEAMFCTTVSVKGSVYRLTSTAPCKTVGDELTCDQTLPVEVIDKNYRVFVKPGVVSCARRLVQVEESMGLSLFYDKDDQFVLPAYAWLADGDWWTPQPQENALFVTEIDPDISEGRFRTRLDIDVSLRIIISMNSKTYHEVNRNGPCRPAVILAALTYALQELRNARNKVVQSCDDMSTSAEDLVYERGLLESAQYLASYFEERQINDWTHDKFNASEAASAYKPLELDQEYDSDEEV